MEDFERAGEGVVPGYFARAAWTHAETVTRFDAWSRGEDLPDDMAGLFFVNFLTTPPESRLSLWSGGIIPVCNVGIGLKVRSSLYLVVLVLTAVANDRIEVQNKEESS
mgnify:CR=1 FL=1